MDCAHFSKDWCCFSWPFVFRRPSGPNCARLAWREDFEGPQPSWQHGEADLEFRLERKERIAGRCACRPAESELIQISGSLGTYAYFTHDVPAGRIVAELTPSVWIKANRPGIQILARVVLPQSIDPRTGRPIATLVRGTSYSSVGSWQQLRIVDIPQLLSRQVRVLRRKSGRTSSRARRTSIRCC